MAYVRFAGGPLYCDTAKVQASRHPQWEYAWKVTVLLESGEVFERTFPSSRDELMQGSPAFWQDRLRLSTGALLGSRVWLPFAVQRILNLWPAPECVTSYTTIWASGPASGQQAVARVLQSTLDEIERTGAGRPMLHRSSVTGALPGAGAVEVLEVDVLSAGLIGSFALLGGVVLAVAGAVEREKRWKRVSRGQCVDCGYPGAAQVDRCTECGAAALERA